jgi:hypothetical protein
MRELARAVSAKQAGWAIGSRHLAIANWHRWTPLSISRRSMEMRTRSWPGSGNDGEGEAIVDETKRRTDGPTRCPVPVAFLSDEPGVLLCTAHTNPGPPCVLGPRRPPMLAMGQRRPCVDHTSFLSRAQHISFLYETLRT